MNTIKLRCAFMHQESCYYWMYFSAIVKMPSTILLRILTTLLLKHDDDNCAINALILSLLCNWSMLIYDSRTSNQVFPVALMLLYQCCDIGYVLEIICSVTSLELYFVVKFFMSSEFWIICYAIFKYALISIVCLAIDVRF